MNKRTVLCLPGDGIGPEIMAATLEVLGAVQPMLATPITIEQRDIGFPALEASGSTVPDSVIEAARQADAVLLGPVSNNEYPPASEGGVNPSGVLRKSLALYANIRPARCWQGIEAPSRINFDLVVARENLEGFYSDRNMFKGIGEFMPEPDIALSVRKITRKGSSRIAHQAFAIARQRARLRGQAKVTAIHKANVLRISDGLFLETVRAVAKEYPEIEYQELIVDAAAALLVRNPAQFDVLVTTNMFGDILTDLASELSGGLGLGGSLNIGDDNIAAQAQHGSAPDIAGQNKANPVSLIVSLSMLLAHFSENAAAEAIDTAVAQALAQPSTRTTDIGGSMTTTQFTQALVHAITNNS